MAQKQVAIIGSGCSGLAAIKTCLEQGLNPMCFESSKDIGGLWRFTSDVEDGRVGSVASSTVMNTSKEMMAFSDFPPPKEFQNFMHHSKVLEYLRMYAERFKLEKHIRVNTHVENVEPNLEYAPRESKDTSTARITSQTDTSCKDQLMTTKYKVCDTCKYHISAKNKSDINSNILDSDLNHSDAYFTNNIGGNTDSSTSVEDIPVDCLDKEKAWMIKIVDNVSGQRNTLHFDFVLVCTGHHAFTNMPSIPGQSDFKGKIIHSRDVRDPDQLEGSRHIVVGIGNSGCDMAVEISKKKKVFLSTRRGTWLMHRLQARGLPADIAFSNRLVFATAFSLPIAVLNYLTARHLNQKIDHELYGLRPSHGPIATHPTVNDELPNRIACGQVVMKPNIRHLEGSRVCFDDGTVEHGIDTIIMATGYHIKYPFLHQSILSTESPSSKNNNNNNSSCNNNDNNNNNNDNNNTSINHRNTESSTNQNHSNHLPLYLYMFPISPPTPTPSIAIIGCVQPGGALAPVSEMQCRLAVKVFKGEVGLPCQSDMLKDMERRRQKMEARYIDTPRHTVQVDYIPYMDELAAMIACKPSIGKMLFKDPKLAVGCTLGPCTAYQYRLQGPGCWDGAREAIMTQMDRVVFPFKTRQCQTQTSFSYSIATWMVCGMFLLCVSQFCLFLIQSL